MTLKTVKKKKKKKVLQAFKSDEWEIDKNSDFPVHEKYTKMEAVKK